MLPCFKPTAHSSKQNLFCGCSVVVQFEPHAVMNLIVSQCDVVLVDGVPLLDADLLRPRSCKAFSVYKAVEGGSGVNRADCPAAVLIILLVQLMPWSDGALPALQ
jgi:hypothetical protein